MKKDPQKDFAVNAKAQEAGSSLDLFEEEAGPLSEASTASRTGRGRRAKRKRTWFDYFLNVLILALFLGGIALLLREPFVRWRRQQLSRELLAAVEANITQQVSYNPRANRLGQAEYDFFEVEADGRIVGASSPSSIEVTTLNEGLQYMTPIGRIEIPLLKINIPLIKEMDYYAMYYAACHWDKTVLPFEPGNSAIFLHRDSFEDYDFTEAERLEENDFIYITYGGARHRYSIVNISTIEPSETMEFLFRNYQSEQTSYITLVTCTPPRVFSHRLLITAIQDDPKPSESSKSGSPQTSGQ